jgi:hypothetical protein
LDPIKADLTPFGRQVKRDNRQKRFVRTTAQSQGTCVRLRMSAQRSAVNHAGHLRHIAPQKSVCTAQNFHPSEQIIGALAFDRGTASLD